MQLKTIHSEIPWAERTEWTFPAMDHNRLSKGVYDPQDVDDAVTHIEALCTQFRRCIQAGGAMGVWPYRLAQIFENVITFEGEPTNFQCLVKNLEGIDNVYAMYAALGKEDGMGAMRLDPGEEHNAGAYFVGPGSDFPIMTIDSFGFKDVDLIYLDIEGAETDALLGAEETINRCQPVIGIEDKKTPLYRRYGYKRSPVDMLVDDFGYTVHARYHLDVILCP